MAELQLSGRMKKLNDQNYNVWSTCLMSYLQGQDLWEVTNGSDVNEPRIDTDGAIHKWRVKVGRAMYLLKTTTEENFLDHIRDLATPKQAWDTLASLFSIRNDTKLQLLENELLSIIGELDQQTQIGDARMKRIIVHGLRSEFQSFVAVVQGWPTPPSLTELENLFAGQEALFKQFGIVTIKAKEEKALYVGKSKKLQKNRDNRDNQDKRDNRNNPKNEALSSKNGKFNNRFPYPCYNCGRKGHIDKYFRQPTEEGNTTKAREEEPWDVEAHVALVQDEYALTATTESKANSFGDWIVDSGCSNHMIGDKN
ncbi:uncharacterized protein LOC143635131 [Bidens hawaiensis]|uniref:uncharacterized protein LOC143635131 n=1 Tax=Bidens hawaiensis TaxID=980011 RepID=UPI00404A5FD9